MNFEEWEASKRDSKQRKDIQLQYIAHNDKDFYTIW